MPAPQTARRSVAMTPELRTRFQQLVSKQGKEIAEADLILQAIREFVDQQEDIVGSRAHFRKTFQGWTDELQTDLIFHLDVLKLLAYGLALMLPSLANSRSLPPSLFRLRLSLPGARRK